MSAAEQFDVRADIEALAVLAEWAEGFCERHAVPPSANFALQLCLEEAVSNVIRHGGLAAEETIGVALQVSGDEMVVDITDHAVAFDPLQAPKPPAAASLEDAVIGGQGIELMRKFCRRMSYRRDDGANRLQVVIQLPTGG